MLKVGDYVYTEKGKIKFVYEILEVIKGRVNPYKGLIIWVKNEGRNNIKHFPVVGSEVSFRMKTKLFPNRKELESLDDLMVEVL